MMSATKTTGRRASSPDSETPLPVPAMVFNRHVDLAVESAVGTSPFDSESQAANDDGHEGLKRNFDFQSDFKLANAPLQADPSPADALTGLQTATPRPPPPSNNKRPGGRSRSANIDPTGNQSTTISRQSKRLKHDSASTSKGKSATTSSATRNKVNALLGLSRTTSFHP